MYLDKFFSGKSLFKKQIVVGTYVFSVVVGMTVKDLSINAISNRGYDKVEHLKPVFLGDTLYVTSRVISERKSKKSKKQKVIGIETFAKNQKNVKVISFTRHILI